MSKFGPDPDPANEDVIEVVAGTHPNRDDEYEPWTAKEIGAVLDAHRKTVLKRLNELHDDNLVNRKNIGVTGAVWWANRDVVSTS